MKYVVTAVTHKATLKLAINFPINRLNAQAVALNIMSVIHLNIWFDAHFCPN